MSLKVMSWVFDRSPSEAGARLVLLALAEHAHDDGSEAYPAVETLMSRTRLSRRAVQCNLRRLEEDGAIDRDGISRKGTTVYRIAMSEGGADSARAQNLRGAESARGGRSLSPDRGADSAPEPKTEPSVNRPIPLSARARADARAVTFRGQKVADELVVSAERLLAVFSVAAGRSLSPRCGDGTVSPALRQVIGALLSHPDVAEDTWTAAVRAAVANPPDWVEGQLQTGHVFGEKAAEWTLATVTETGEARALPRRRNDNWTVEDYIEAGEAAANGAVVS